MKNFLGSANNENVRGLTSEEIETTKIFLIDDEPIILQIYESHLASAGFKSIYAFSDSVEAVETLRYVTPGIILTDIHMPEVSGNFLIKLIRTYEHLRTVPIVAVTSDTDDETREGILRKGANRVMYKPVDKAKIVDCVRRSIESHRKLTLQLSKAKSREQAQSEQKNAEQISLESNLRNLMR